MTDFAGKIRGSARKLVCTPINRLVNRIDPPVIVLLYHRVTTLSSDPEMLAVTPGNFRAQMQYLRETVPLVRFEEDWAKTTRPAVCVTFDDGYADNALEALPILEELGVPATFFVSTGTIGTAGEFWWHELERIILTNQSLPPNVTLKAGRHTRTWLTGTVSERQEFFRAAVQLMTNADTVRRNDLLNQIRVTAESAAEATGDTHRSMSIEELRLLASSRWATIGAHTVTHTRLSSLTADAQRMELETSKRELESWLDRKINVFSYPYGRRCHYTTESVALCREIGFSKAAANFPGQAHSWTDLCQIPRHLVRNWPLEMFTEKLRGFWTR
jgi:peptidoglycan/xylan/chitin deacetylase (PgdA/CDA1 family)